jgi:L-cysteine/cystine lyase
VSWAEQRARFPVFEHTAYLNAGTFGPLARATADAVAAVQAHELERGRAGRAYFEEYMARRDRVRALIAAEAGVDAANVALTDSTTQGVQLVVSGLALGPDDEVVTTDLEHFGLVGPLVAAGARVRVAKLRDLTVAEGFDAIRALVTPRTRLIALSHIAWIDGRRLPWRELREATDVPVLVDGAQGVGAVEVDAGAADFYTISAQKWLCGPAATGALTVRDPEALPLRLVSYLSQSEYSIADATFTPKEGAARFDPLFTAPASLAGLEAALTDLPEGRHARACELCGVFRAALVEAGHEVVTEPGQSTLVSWRARGDSAEATAALYERGVVVRELPGTGLLRASVGWWNDESDLERLLEGLRAIG